MGSLDTPKKPDSFSKYMRENWRFVPILIFVLLGSLTAIVSCQADAPVKDQGGLTHTFFTPTASLLPSLATKTPNFTSVVPSKPAFNGQLLEAIGTNSLSCLPERTEDDIGVYIYDLKDEQELVSINADTPFQFASAFKAPVLVYFLSSCKQYWDVGAPEWTLYFSDRETAGNIDWYTSGQYKQQVISQLSDVNNWNNLETYFATHPVMLNDVVDGPIDKRYFILSQVYSMVARSSNPATGDVLRFVYDHCLEQPPEIPETCGGLNPITAYNAWFNNFAGIPYETKESYRGLYEWDVILETNRNGKIVEKVMSTHGLKDECADQVAYLDCSLERHGQAINAMTARDFFRFYDALYYLEDEKVRDTAFNILKIDLKSPSRGNLKNLARVLQAEAMSKNGQAFYNYASIVTDAGILNYRGDSFIIVTLSFNAPETVKTLYGEYNSSGELISAPGLIQTLVEQNNAP